MEINSKSEWFILDSPIAEPSEKWDSNEKYHIERKVRVDGAIFWYGLSVTWKKEKNGVWTRITNKNTKIDLKVCEMPIYEKLYLEEHNSIKKQVCEQLISYIENDAEIAIPIERFFDITGAHITKKEYGKVLLEILCEELRERFTKVDEVEKLK